MSVCLAYCVYVTLLFSSAALSPMRANGDMPLLLLKSVKHQKTSQDRTGSENGLARL